MCGLNILTQQMLTMVAKLVGKGGLTILGISVEGFDACDSGHDGSVLMRPRRVSGLREDFVRIPYKVNTHKEI